MQNSAITDYILYKKLRKYSSFFLLCMMISTNNSSQASSVNRHICKRCPGLLFFLTKNADAGKTPTKFR